MTRRPSLRRGRSRAAVLAALLIAFAAAAEAADYGYRAVWPCAGAIVTASRVDLPEGNASDDWVRGGSTPWADEAQRRQQQLQAYLCDADIGRAAGYGFRTAPADNVQTPALAWNWYTQHPIGYVGMPYVLLKALLSLDPADPVVRGSPPLLKLAKIWRQPSLVPAEAASASGQAPWTLDHLGAPPHPENYDNGALKPVARWQQLLPNGFVYDPTVTPPAVPHVEAELARTGKLTLMEAGLRKMVGDRWQAIFGQRPSKHADLQKAPPYDATFFSCSACHQGRVIVGGEMDADGRILNPGRMQFLPGMPNTEIEAQHFSRLIMQTGLALTLPGAFSLDMAGLPKAGSVKADKTAVQALYQYMLGRAQDPQMRGTVYGTAPEQVARAQQQTLAVARNFPAVMADLIGSAVKTQFIYMQVAARNGYNPARAPGRAEPDVLSFRQGQMDAFGIASGLVAIHAARPDNSYVTFICKDSGGKNPIFSYLGVTVGPDCAKEPLAEAARRLQTSVATWAPPVPAPIDIPSLNWAGQRALANWDGNQGPSSRTLASGTSATGDPSKVNVRIHEPLNPLINHMPPPPYPFAVNREKAQRGMAIFYDRDQQHLRTNESCTACHVAGNDKIYPARAIGVDVNRAIVNTDISRHGLAALVKESCTIFMTNHPGNDWCLPRATGPDGKPGKAAESDWNAINDDYFKPTPDRIRQGAQGYRADMPHGIWARAPYLHNGSVPTLGALLCPAARPAVFKRGVLFYDQALVGFEWAVAPQQRYAPNETMLVRDYDTRVYSQANGGHAFGSSLCPDLAGLDPLRDRAEIARRIGESKAGDLLEYLKTL